MPLPVPPIVVVQFLFMLTAVSLAAAWWVYPALRGRPLRVALPPLLLVHLVRPVSLWLLAPGAMVKETMPQKFAMGTAYGDLLSASLALVAVLLVRKQARVAVAVVWLFNLVGFFDVMRNVLYGMVVQAPTHMGAMGFVPGYGVPIVIVSHVLIFKLLVDHRRVKVVS